MQYVSDEERAKLLVEKSYQERCTTPVKDIKVGQTVRGFFSRGYIEMFVGEVNVNADTYDKNNCGVWVKGEVIKKGSWYYNPTININDRGYDLLRFSIDEMVEVIQPMLTNDEGEELDQQYQFGF
tara:strand:+ start:3829 stop:4203 length:375 start_codon:yes stop_codon:yes gene_type:complete